MQRIAAGIVLYNPDLKRLEENINSILLQVEKVVLIDNGSDNFSYIENKYNNNSSIVILRNNDNLGIAIALNQIVDYAYNNNFNWVLTLDQDSVCPNNLINEYKKYINFKQVAIITPKILDRNCKKKDCKSYSNYEFVEECITSASLTNVRICKQIKAFDEKMFIDFVDFDYCTRVILNNYKILKVNTVVLLHEVGRLDEKYILGKKIHVYNHSVIRKYYYCRNIIYFCNKYKEKINTKKYYNKLIKRFLVVLLYEDNKLNKIKFMIKGIKDGIKMEYVKYS